MSGILILMHNCVNVKIWAKMAALFLKEYALDSKIMAPIDFVTPGVNQQQK